MAKSSTIKVKLVSSADTGFYYVTRKNSRTMTEKLVNEEIRSGGQEARRIHANPRSSRLRRRVKIERAPQRRPFCSQTIFAERQIRWPAGNGVMRRPLAPLPCRPNPTDPGDAADLSIP